MAKRQRLSRREFLRLSAFTAATATLVACGGGGGGPAEEEPAPGGASPAPGAASPAPGASPAADGAAPGSASPAPGAASPAAEAGQLATPTPVEAPTSFSEAPMIKEMGDLPPVEERLPENPLVIAHPWLKPGQYGGTMRWATDNTGDISLFIHESQYGHSPLRWHKDGLAIGPNLVEEWESNDDASEWTLHFREGLKWSDGEPWTTADIMYWWEDMVQNEQHPEVPPDEARSGKGTIAKLEAVDDYTLKMTFDAPAPLTADRLAMWVNAGIGPRWMAPRHYLEQFHPKYSDKYKDFETHDQKMIFRNNPECPTMTGWRLREYREGQRAVWERNPYYWCVDTEGNQLPYIDRIDMKGVQDAEVLKLTILEGQVDWAQFHGLTLADVAALRDAQERNRLEVRFWDSGSGTGVSIFFNYDFRDDKMRELIRTPQFRQALSHAYNRPEAQKVIYFNTGELTTGTFSPKAIEYNFNEEAKQRYAEWRDSYVEFDPDKAKALLDEIGVVDKDGDGWREMPDGSKLTVRQDFVADAGRDSKRMNALLVRDWKAIGINASMNPVPPAGFDEQWQAGELMSNAHWGIGDGPNHLVFPQWLVPLEETRWAPLHGNWYKLRGTEQEGTEEDKDPWKRTPPRMEAEEGSPIDRLWQIYDQARVEPDAIKRHRLVWDMIKIHVEEGPFVQGTVANFPRIILVREGLMNVPTKEDLDQHALGGFTDPWIHPTPAVYDPEAYFWDDPEAHS